MSRKKNGGGRNKQRNSGFDDDQQSNMNRKGKKARKAVRAEAESLHQHANMDRSIPKVPKPLINTPLAPKTSRQKELMRCVKTKDITFATGPAGTGKTYVVAGMACDLLVANQLDTLYITRPVQTADEELGFTTGDLDEKFAIHLEPYWDVFHDRLGRGLTEYYLKTGRIVPAPLGFMRGRTFKDSWVILDEAQNTTKNQMKMFLTRIGENGKLIINGDLSQVDLKRDVMSGLRDAMRRFANSPRFGNVQFTKEDSVRHGLLKEILEGYEEDF